MANLDTEDKRRTAANFYLFNLAPTPDLTVDDNDRMNVTGFYSGIDPGAPPAATPGGVGEGLLLKVYKR